MKIPLSIVLDELDLHYTYHIKSEDNPQFQWVNLFVPKHSKSSGDFLQVCTLTEALEASMQKNGYYYLCLRDRIADESETEEALQGMVIINENMDLRELFNQVQKIFIKLNKWLMQLQQSIVRNEGIQKLIDLSEPIIDNYIHVLDPTFKVLAYTKNILFEDPIVTDVTKYGYLQEGSIKKIQKAGIYKLYKKTDQLIINKERNVCDYITAERTFKYNSTYTTQVILVFCNKDFSKGQLELFKILTDFIKIYVDKFYSSHTTSCPEAVLLTDIIEEKTIDTDAIRQRAQSLALPFTGYFNLFNISFADYKNIPEKRVAREVSELLAASKVMNFKETILALNIYKDKDLQEMTKKNMLKINNLLNKYGAFCGISNIFSNLAQLRRAYKQTEIATRFGIKLLKKKQPPWKVAAHANHKRFVNVK